MSNLYQILGISNNASQNDINNSAQKKLKEIQSMKKSAKEKEILSNNVMEAFNILNDYHKRRAYDDKLESQISPFSNFLGFGNFFNNLPSEDVIKTTPNSYFKSYSSSSTMNSSRDGGKTIYQKSYSNNNGKVEEKSQKITIDKDGNKSVEDMPKENKNKYNLKDKSNSHKIKYNI